jgi:hypothetical protein
MLVLSPARVFAAAVVEVSRTAEGVFLVQGSGFQAVAALELTITYDPAALSGPQVVLGPLFSGSLSAINPNVPGIIRMAFVRTSPVSGTGSIVNITFERQGTAQGRIISCSAKLAGENGSLLPVQARVVDPPEPAPNTGTLAQSEGSSVAVPAAGTANDSGSGKQPLRSSTGILTGRSASAGNDPGTESRNEPEPRPADMQPPVREMPRSDRLSEDLSRDLVSASASTLVPRKIHVQKSVLEAFRDYSGKRSPKALMSLFKQDGIIGFRQDPSVAIADGATPVRVFFISASEGRKPSDIAVMGAKILSLQPDPDFTNTWILELLPFKNDYQASVTVPQGSIFMVFPLTLAPKISTALPDLAAGGEASFERFLLDRGTRKKPVHDLNGDGKRDYLDDYIYTANYLISISTERGVTRKK